MLQLLRKNRNQPSIHPGLGLALATLCKAWSKHKGIVHSKVNIYLAPDSQRQRTAMEAYCGLQLYHKCSVARYQKKLISKSHGSSPNAF